MSVLINNLIIMPNVHKVLLVQTVRLRSIKNFETSDTFFNTLASSIRQQA